MDIPPVAIIGTLKFEKRCTISNVLAKIGAPDNPPPAMEKLLASTFTSIGETYLVFPALIIILSNDEATSPIFNNVSFETSGDTLIEMTLPKKMS